MPKFRGFFQTFVNFCVLSSVLQFRSPGGSMGNSLVYSMSGYHVLQISYLLFSHTYPIAGMSVLIPSNNYNNNILRSWDVVTFSEYSCLTMLGIGCPQLLLFSVRWENVIPQNRSGRVGMPICLWGYLSLHAISLSYVTIYLRNNSRHRATLPHV